MTTLISGEDQVNDWLKVADGAHKFQSITPRPTTGTLVLLPNSNKILGATGAAGDYLKSLSITVLASSPADAAVFLLDGTPTPMVSGTSGTVSPAVPAGSVLPLVASATFSAAANLYAGHVLSVTYTPTNGEAVTVKKRIVSHAAVSSSTAFNPVLSSNFLVGATLTAWSVEPPPASFEVIPHNMPKGVYEIPIGAKSRFGPWKVSIGTEVSVVASGNFT